MKYILYNQPEMPENYLPFSNLLDEKETSILKANSNIVKFRKKDIIFKQNTRTSHIMVVTSGMIKIFKEGRNNKIIILKLATSGNYIGILSVLGDQIHQYSASAIDDSDICFIDINCFKNIILENGKFAFKLLTLISQEGLYIFNRLMSQTQKQLPGRIADVLLYFSNEIYHDTRFRLPLSRRELAELAGTTKESLIRTFAEFRNDKIINLKGPEVEIMSIEIVKTLSEFG